ncbi:MAG TPA: alpha/beta fold hydrolase [Thermoanaerobaculia bacterium]|nr:alpha/beta fold hydrolase [Thermoanaerobaculia bacterium]
MSATAQAAPRHVTAPSLMRAAIRVLAAVAPPLAVRAAARLFRFPVRPRTSALPGERFAVRVGRHTVRGGVRGDGPLVLLLHGWGGSEQQFDVLGDTLAARGFRVATISAIGHGASSSRFSSMVEFRDSLRAVAAHFGVEPHAVIGHSLGGAASALTVSEGLRTSRLVLIAASAHPSRYLGLFLDWLDFPHALRARVVQHFEKTLGFAWDRLDIEAMGPRVHVPTLIIHDRADREVPYSEGADAARLIPNAQLVTVESLGHRRILRDAEVVARIADFLA